MNRVLFLHIHKTAGTSLKQQLLQSVPVHAVCPYPFEWQVRQLDRATLNRFAFFFGHITPSALPFPSSELTRITMLREPKRRLLSAFAFWKQIAPRNQQIEFFRAIAPLSLLQFLRHESPIIRRATWNVQARLLAGGSFGPSDDLRTNVFGPDIEPGALGDLAQEKLDGFALVGAVERYSESLCLARQLLGLGGSLLPEVHNRSGATDQHYAQIMANSDIAEALHELTDIDCRVHAAALRRLEKQAKQMRASNVIARSVTGRYRS